MRGWFLLMLMGSVLLSGCKKEPTEPEKTRHTENLISESYNEYHKTWCLSQLKQTDTLTINFSVDYPDTLSVDLWDSRGNENGGIMWEKSYYLHDINWTIWVGSDLNLPYYLYVESVSSGACSFCVIVKRIWWE